MIVFVIFAVIALVLLFSVSAPRRRKNFRRKGKKYWQRVLRIFSFVQSRIEGERDVKKPVVKHEKASPPLEQEQCGPGLILKDTKCEPSAAHLAKANLAKKESEEGQTGKINLEQTCRKAKGNKELCTKKCLYYNCYKDSYFTSAGCNNIRYLSHVALKYGKEFGLNCHQTNKDLPQPNCRQRTTKESCEKGDYECDWVIYHPLDYTLEFKPQCVCKSNTFDDGKMGFGEWEKKWRRGDKMETYKFNETCGPYNYVNYTRDKDRVHDGTFWDRYEKP